MRLPSLISITANNQDAWFHLLCELTYFTALFSKMKVKQGVFFPNYPLASDLEYQSNLKALNSFL